MPYFFFLLGGETEHRVAIRVPGTYSRKKKVYLYFIHGVLIDIKKWYTSLKNTHDIGIEMNDIKLIFKWFWNQSLLKVTAVFVLPNLGKKEPVSLTFDIKCQNM